jgi:co-chaperonin GroES (HSP10)
VKGDCDMMGMAALAARASVEEDEGFAPLADRIFVKVKATDEETTPGGIILAKTRRDVILEGVVVAIGPEVAVLQVGDRVLKVEVLGVNAGDKAGVATRHPELKDVHILREHEVTAAKGPRLRQRAADAHERGIRIGAREWGRW